MSTRRTYQQYCGLASALDVVGERWTLLIVRELLMGPARYSDILANLPGLGTNLLAERLKFLVERGVVHQVDVRGTGAQLAYALTPVGEQLRPLVLGLARWGMEFVGDLRPEDTVRPHWGFLAVEAMLDQSKVSDVDECYEFRVDDQVFHIAVSGGRASAVKGAAESPAMVARTDAATFVQIGAGRLTPLIAMVTGRLALEGDMDAVVRCCDVLGLETGMPARHAGQVPPVAAV
ncbi:winged helix-turn-helix transcriptional regulator [Goodfellowiella coeruleoviolacea]|uniref:Transcriptional regulator, HxlR family n=1 Tax=Goodfellowiella coeruleoviolacea TaxID=334858 RepID=A0AAE3GHC1_9PSEU|nr:winged helix-turn-helix transcriptional regulator [Goodfellowiella coeruleoviolacea]MCP2167733.1 transcriptional regulator, HxlR family [Goodfellowiella coeruleoviolacea]